MEVRISVFYFLSGFPTRVDNVEKNYHDRNTGEIVLQYKENGEDVTLRFPIADFDHVEAYPVASPEEA